MPKQYSIDEMQAQIRQLEATMQLPGVPADEIAIYSATIKRIRVEIAARQAQPATPEPPKPPLQPIKTTIPPPPQEIIINTNDKSAPIEWNTAPKPTTHTPPNGGEVGGIKPRTIHAGNQHPIHSQRPMSATIQADHATNPHNPTVTITWADEYTYTGDETAIRGRFITTFRDTIALKLVQKGRYDSMWRWSSPWRAAGFYQALTYLIGHQPTLHDLDIKRPSDLITTVFANIAEKSRIFSHYNSKKMECCTVTKGRAGESGAWCVDCGKKVLAVEYRECGGCLNFKDGICTRFLMSVPKTMLATYKINDGTCFVPA